MSTVEITRVEDTQPGDHVTLTRNGTTVSGAVRDVTHADTTHYLTHADTTHYFDIANLPCEGLIVGDAGDGYWTFVSATREVPDLPTEPGSVIVNATIRGVEGQTAIRDPEGDWFTTTCVEDYYFHPPEYITAWTPARIVPEGGAS